MLTIQMTAFSNKPGKNGMAIQELQQRVHTVHSLLN